MSYDNKPKANWIHTVNTTEGLRLEVSDKGAFKLSQVLPSGEVRFMTCFQPAHLKAIINASGEIGNFLVSDEYKAIEENKVLVKEKAKIATQMQREQEKAMRTAQAAIEALRRMGVEVNLSATKAG